MTMRDELRAAMNDLLWATLPLRDVLKQARRAAFMQAWSRASQAYCTGAFKPEKTPLQHPHEEALKLHMLCLDACAALGVKGHELVPHYNDRADAGFHAQGDATAPLTALAMECARIAQALLDQQDVREARHAAAD